MLLPHIPHIFYRPHIFTKEDDACCNSPSNSAVTSPISIPTDRHRINMTKMTSTYAWTASTVWSIIKAHAKTRHSSRRTGRRRSMSSISVKSSLFISNHIWEGRVVACHWRSLAFHNLLWCCWLSGAARKLISLEWLLWLPTPAPPRLYFPVNY